MKFNRDTRRKLVNYVMVGLAIVCVLAALIPLASILFTSIVRGLSAFSLAFFTQTLPPPCANGVGCQSGGISNVIQGTFILIGLAAGISVPLGILAGICMSEYPELRIGQAIRFLVDVLVGVPSIVVGLFIFAALLYGANLGWFSTNYVQSALAGSLALAVIMVPIIARTTDEALRIVPTTLREASLALGIPRYRGIARVILPTAKTGVVTGTLLALARGIGETAPLIVLGLGSFFYLTSLDGKAAALPLTIYLFGLSPYSNWIAIAWGTSLVVVLIMLGLSVAVRFALGGRLRSAGPGGG
jgi:phosphate transport system permease protein